MIGKLKWNGKSVTGPKVTLGEKRKPGVPGMISKAPVWWVTLTNLCTQNNIAIRTLKMRPEITLNHISPLRQWRYSGCTPLSFLIHVRVSYQQFTWIIIYKERTIKQNLRQIQPFKGLW